MYFGSQMKLHHRRLNKRHTTPPKFRHSSTAIMGEIRSCSLAPRDPMMVTGSELGGKPSNPPHILDHHERHQGQAQG